MEYRTGSRPWARWPTGPERRRHPGRPDRWGPHRHSEVWSAAADRADTSVFVTPEYIHGVDALAEYALAFVDVEWNHTPVGFVSDDAEPGRVADPAVRSPGRLPWPEGEQGDGSRPVRLRMAAAALAVLSAPLLAACAAPLDSQPLPYARPGPEPVGVTTLDLGPAGALGERLATVYYPADRYALSGHPRFSYSEDSTLPAPFRGILPAKYDTVTTVDATSDPPASHHGPYPVVLFSHGYGGERLQYSHLLTGIASWGYVVVSADYLERGLAAQVLGRTAGSTPAQDSAVLQASLTAVEQASADPASVLAGSVDPTRVAAVGHSAGGQTALDALADPVVATAVGWAPVGPAGAPSPKPVLLITATGDTVVPPAAVRTTYRSFPGPKALVEVSGAGHNTYTDICDTIRSGGGLLAFAVAHHLVAPALARLGENGCQPTDLAPTRFWPVVQFYTVFQLKTRLGRNGPVQPVPRPAPGQFPGVHVDVVQVGR